MSRYDAIAEHDRLMDWADYYTACANELRSYGGNTAYERAQRLSGAAAYDRKARRLRLRAQGLLVAAQQAGRRVSGRW